jgi:hypothetical protein
MSITSALPRGQFEVEEFDTATSFFRHRPFANDVALDNAREPLTLALDDVLGFRFQGLGFGV